MMGDKMLTKEEILTIKHGWNLPNSDFNRICDMAILSITLCELMRKPNIQPLGVELRIIVDKLLNEEISASKALEDLYDLALRQRDQAFEEAANLLKQSGETTHPDFAHERVRVLNLAEIVRDLKSKVA